VTFIRNPRAAGREHSGANDAVDSATSVSTPEDQARPMRNAADGSITVGLAAERKRWFWDRAHVVPESLCSAYPTNYYRRSLQAM